MVRFSSRPFAGLKAVQEMVPSMISGFTRKDFLEAIFRDYFKKRDGFVMVKTLRHLETKVSTRYFPNVEILSREAYLDDQTVFFGVCPRETMKPDRNHVRYLTAFWATVDMGPESYSGEDSYFRNQSQAAKAVRSFPLPPSIIVESGTGMHLYWLMKDVVELPDPNWTEAQLTKIAGYFKCKMLASVDATLRLPGTVNSKVPGHPSMCKVKYVNTDFRYDPIDFEKVVSEASLFPLGHMLKKRRTSGISPLSPPEGVQGARRSSQADPGPASVGERRSTPALAAEAPDATSGADLLEPHPSPFSGPGGWGEEGEGTAGRALPSTVTVVEVEEESLEAEAEMIADMVMERLSGKLLDDLADRIADKLLKKLKGARSSWVP